MVERLEVVGVGAEDEAARGGAQPVGPYEAVEPFGDLGDVPARLGVQRDVDTRGALLDGQRRRAEPDLGLGAHPVVEDAFVVAPEQEARSPSRSRAVAWPTPDLRCPWPRSGRVVCSRRSSTAGTCDRWRSGSSVQAAAAILCARSIAGDPALS